jgi:hypothetical protein
MMGGVQGGIMSVAVAIAESKGFNALNKASRKYRYYAVNHDHTFKFAPAELRQMMAVSGAGPGCRGRPPGFL